MQHSRATLSRSAGNDFNVEVLRGVAAILVAYFHVRVIAWIGVRDYWHAHGTSVSINSLFAYLTFPVVWGAIGVPIFFVISGYCIHRSHAARIMRDSGYRVDAKIFWLRRFVRIYPVLFCALLLTLALDSLSLSFFPHNERLGNLGWSTFGMNLAALQGTIAPNYGSNGALWTLSLEIQFYVLYPLLFALERLVGKNKLLVGLAFLAICSYIAFERRGIVVFSSYWLSWYLGAYIADLQVSDARVPSAKRLSLIGGVLLIAGCGVSARNEYIGFQLWAVSFAAILIVVLQAKAWKSIFARIFAKLGTFSYSIYIVHLPIFVLLTSWLFHSKKPDSIFYSFAFLIVAVGLAYVFHLAIERPAIRLLQSSRRTPSPRGKMVAD